MTKTEYESLKVGNIVRHKRVSTEYEIASITQHKTWEMKMINIPFENCGNSGIYFINLAICEDYEILV